jgi:hypothetical protein
MHAQPAAAARPDGLARQMDAAKVLSSSAGPPTAITLRPRSAVAHQDARACEATHASQMAAVLLGRANAERRAAITLPRPFAVALLASTAPRDTTVSMEGVVLQVSDLVARQIVTILRRIFAALTLLVSGDVLSVHLVVPAQGIATSHPLKSAAPVARALPRTPAAERNAADPVLDAALTASAPQRER